ncbi:MAG: DUF4130 domain-containing protein [Candidatus Hermodarchaeota archaeon]
MNRTKIISLLQRHKDFLNKPLKERKKIVKEIMGNSKAVIETKLTTTARNYYNMARAVSNEIHYNKMFTRLRIEENMILTGYIQPVHLVEDLILEFFYNRFPKYTLILFSGKKNRSYIISPKQISDDLRRLNRIKFTVKKDYLIGNSNLKLKEIISIISPILAKYSSINPLLDNELDSKELFKSFYESQFIKSRENLRLFNQNMPKRYQKKKDMETERSFHTKTIDKFIVKL